MSKKLWDSFVKNIGLYRVEQLTDTFRVQPLSLEDYPKSPYLKVESDHFQVRGSDPISSVRVIEIGSSKRGIHSRFALEYLNTYENNNDDILITLSLDFEVLLCKVTHTLLDTRTRRRVKDRLGISDTPYSINYENIFLRHRATGSWYSMVEDLYKVVGRPFDIQRYTEKEDYIPSLWSGDLPIIGISTLETAYQSKLAEMDFLSCLDIIDNIAENEEIELKKKEIAEKERETQRETNRVALALILANLLVDRNLSIHNEVTKEDITRLVKNGLLELEDLNLANLSLQDLVDEIVDRIPEDQKEAFIERTQELLNVST